MGKYTRDVGFLKRIGGYVPCIMWITSKYGLVISAVFGNMWRYSQMNRGVCQATLTSIASDLGLGYSSVQRSIRILEEDGLIIDRTPTLRNRPHTYIIKESVILKAYKNWKDNIANPEIVSNMVRDTLKDIKEKDN